jgi:hypothetical protein
MSMTFLQKCKFTLQRRSPPPQGATPIPYTKAPKVPDRHRREFIQFRKLLLDQSELPLGSSLSTMVRHHGSSACQAELASRVNPHSQLGREPEVLIVDIIPYD